MKRKETPEIPSECWDCPLPDCYPKDPRCPVLRSKAEKAGITLPIIPIDAPMGKNGRPCVPEDYKDRAEYQRKYKWRYRKVLLKGVKLRRTDIQLLQQVCADDGRTLEEWVVGFLEEMAKKARLMGVV